MAEATVTQDEYRQLERDLREKILDKAASDSEWGRQYIENPDEAMQAASFPEAQKLQEMRQNLKPFDPEAEDVQGHDYSYYYEICYNYTTYYEWQYYYLDT